MGADMILEYVIVKQDLKTSEQDMLKAVDELTDKDLEKIEDYYIEVHGDFEGAEEPIRKVSTAKAEFKEVIEDFFKCVNHRDVTYIDHLGERLYITGGLSFGEPPTESAPIRR